MSSGGAPFFEAGPIVSQTMFSLSVTAPTSGAKTRPQWAGAQVVG